MAHLVQASRRAVVALGIVAGALLLWASPAAAHAALVETDPVAGQSVDTAPEAVTLSFNEAVDIGLGGVRLYDQDGRLVDTGPAESEPGGRVVRLPVGDLDDGSYVVTWRVTSADEHPVQGAFTFAVGAVGANVEGLADRLLASEGASVAVGVLDTVMRFALYVFFVLLVGPVTFTWFAWRQALGSRAVRRMMWIGWGGLIGATVLGVLVRGPYLAAFPLSDAFDGDVISEVIDTRYGWLSIARVVLLLIAVPVLLQLRGPRSHPAAYVAGAVLGIGVALTIAGSGHAGTGEQVALSLPADAAHLCAVGLWFGGLVVLVAAALGAMPRDDAVSAVRRFSQVALVAVAIIVVTGSYQAWREIRQLDALTETDYGRVLLVKLALVGVIVFVASLSRDIVHKRLTVPKEAPGDRVDAAVSEEEDRTPLPVGPGAKLADELDERVSALRSLRRTVAVEVAFGVAVLAASAVLAGAPPAADALAEPFAEIVHADGMDFDVQVAPATTGRNDIHVQALDPDGTLTDVVDLEIFLSEPERDIATIEAEVRRLGPGHYTVPGFDFPFEGEWQLDMRAFRTDTDFVDATTTVDIR